MDDRLVTPTTLSELLFRPLLLSSCQLQPRYYSPLSYHSRGLLLECLPFSVSLCRSSLGAVSFWVRRGPSHEQTLLLHTASRIRPQLIVCLSAWPSTSSLFPVSAGLGYS